MLAHCVLCSNNCSTLIVDYHRNCKQCGYDLCLRCCHELRSGLQPGGTQAESTHSKKDEKEEEAMEEDIKEAVNVEEEEEEKEEVKVEEEKAAKRKRGRKRKNPPKQRKRGRQAEESDDDLQVLNGAEVDVKPKPEPKPLPPWIVNADGSIPCPPKARGGCDETTLCLRTLFDQDWTAKLTHDVENAASVYDSGRQLWNEVPHCATCDMVEAANKMKDLHYCANRKDASENYLFCPTRQSVEEEDLRHFQRHWMRGEPVIVRGVLECTSGLS